MIHRLRGRIRDTRVLLWSFLFFVRSRARPESVNDHLSGLFRALPRSDRLSTTGLGPVVLRRSDWSYRGFPGTLLLYGSEKLRTCTQFTEQGTRA